MADTVPVGLFLGHREPEQKILSLRISHLWPGFLHLVEKKWQRLKSWAAPNGNSIELSTLSVLGEIVPFLPPAHFQGEETVRQRWERTAPGHTPLLRLS